MHAIFRQLSILIGLFVFLNQLWHYAPLDRALSSGIGTGLVLYLVVILGEAIIRRILEYTPPQLADETAGSTSASAADRAAHPSASEPTEKTKKQAA